MPNGTVGTAYNQTLSASTTATGPFTWNISSGSLPTGLTFATSSPIISGTPTTIGTSTFNVGVTNGSASTTQSYTINIVGTTTATSTATSTSPGTGGGTTGGGSSSGGGVVTSFGRSGGHSGGRIATSTLVINPGILTAGNSIQPFIFTRTLSFPMRNDDVMQLQKRLSSEGFFNGPITGYFGNLTRAAVRAYQKAKNISPVGTVGPMTRSFLNR